MTVTPMSPHPILEAELLEDDDLEEVMIGGVYGTVDDAAIRYVPLVGAVTGTTAAVADAWRLSRSDWKLDWAAAEAVAWTETLVLVVVGEEVSEVVCVVSEMSTEMYISMYQ
jgi:hypothetical protein